MSPTGKAWRVILFTDELSVSCVMLRWRGTGASDRHAEYLVRWSLAEKSNRSSLARRATTGEDTTQPVRTANMTISPATWLPGYLPSTYTDVWRRDFIFSTWIFLATSHRCTSCMVTAMCGLKSNYAPRLL